MDLQWWEVIGVPLLIAGGSVAGWLMKRSETRRTEERLTNKEQRDADRSLLERQLLRLEDAAEQLRTELKEVAPQLGALRKEYSEAVQREVALLEQLRDLSVKQARSESQAASERRSAAQEQERLRVAIRLLHKRVRQLRNVLVDNGISVPPEPDINTVIGGEEEETSADE